MSANPKQARAQLPKRLLKTQALVATVFVLLVWVLLSVEAAQAAAFGALIALLTNAYFATRSFVLPAGATAEQMFRAMLRAQIVKLLLAAVLFAVAAKLFSEHYAVLIGAWFATTAVYFLALRWF